MKRFELVISCALVVSACDESTTTPLRVVHEAGTITGGEVWAKGVHVLEGNINIEGGVLEVAPCSVIEMPNSGVLSAQNGGSLNFVGSADCPITITSGQAVPAPGDWNEIDIENDASNSNIFDWVVIEYGGGSSYGSVWLDTGASLSMTNSTVRHSGHTALRLYEDAHVPGFVGNTLVDNAEGAMHVFASAVADLGVGVYGPNDVDGILIQGGTVSSDATWLAHDAPYVLESNVSINGGSGSARLTVEAGATIKMGEARVLSVDTNGGLTLAGTATAPVTITSAKPVPAAGDWNEIDLEHDSVGAYNDFDYAIIEYGGGSSYGSIWLDEGVSLAMTNTIVRHSGDSGLRLYDDSELRDFTGNTLINNTEGPLQMFANAIENLGQGTYSPNPINGIRIVGGTVDHDCTWLAHDAPYILESNVSINGGSGSARLTVEAGATLKLAADRVLSVDTNGGLTLAGTSTHHVTVTSAAAVPAAGDWNEIDLEDDSVAAYNTFTYADIMYGGGSSYGQLWVDDSAGVTLDNVSFSNAGGGCDVRKYTNGTVTDAGGNTFTLCN